MACIDQSRLGVEQIRDGVFTNWKFAFAFDPRLHDLQFLTLDLFHFVFLFLKKNWYIAFAKLNKPTLSNKSPRLN